MEPLSPSTPLISLSACAIDTETTGLDPRKARLLQIAAVRMSGAAIYHGESYASFVNPGVPVPPASTEIHGISDADLVGAPAFGKAWAEFDAFTGASVLIGYRTGFDITTLKRECGLAAIAWRDRQWLCVETLSRLVMPATFAVGSLEGVAEWLGITIEGRHTALGDARAAAGIWAGLIPLLRKQGIQTLGEALTAGAGLINAQSHEVAQMTKGGEADVSGLPPITEAIRVDSYLYRHVLADLMSQPAQYAPADATLRDAARLLIDKQISSVLVESGGKTGIVTERDLLRGLATEQPDRPTVLADIMSHPLHSLPAGSRLYRAIARMNRLGMRHLAVSGEDGRIAGILTPRNLLRERATEAIVLGDEIDTAPDGAALAAARAKLTPLAKALLQDGMDAYGVCGVISAELCGLTRRAAEIAEARMARDGLGEPPVPYAVMVLGSGGRGESLLAPDQDNAIIFEQGDAGGPADKWFAALGGHIADLLDEAGVPYCKGGIMARNAEWRKSKADWQQTIDTWVRQSRPQDLLNVDIFFDGVPVHGSAWLAEDVWRYAYSRAHSSTAFQKLLTELARNWRSPLGFLGGFRADKDDRTDLKLAGLMPIFTGARVLSIRHQILVRSSAERLRGAAETGALNADAVEDVLSGHQTTLRAILSQQILDANAGVPLSNYVATGKMAAPERRRLREAVKTIATVIDAVSEARL